MDNDKLLEVNPYFENVAKEKGFYSSELMDTIALEGGIQHIEEIPEDVRKVFVMAHDISPEWHIQMQAAFQKHTDNAVSKTVNLPSDATVDDVLKIYNLAYELDCKGVTIYRDGSKENQVLSIAAKDKLGDTSIATVKERPETLEGFTSKMNTGYGQLYVTVTELDGHPFRQAGFAGLQIRGSRRKSCRTTKRYRRGASCFSRRRPGFVNTGCNWKSP
jgi:ribonucleoside-diphosphate reductase alpha chain